MEDDDEPSPPEELSLGRERRRDVLDRLAAVRDILRNRLGRWFTPVAVVAGALCLALVVAAALAIGDDDAESRPAAASATPASTAPATSADEPVAAGLAVGDPPALPYYANDALRWPATTEVAWEHPPAALVARGGAALALTRGHDVILLDGAQLIRLDRDVASGPVISPDGEMAAWVADDPRGGSLVVWDLTTGERDETVPLVRERGCCEHGGADLVGADADHRVYLSSPGGYQIWSPESDDLMPLVTGVSPNLGANPLMVSVNPIGPVFVETPSSAGRMSATYGAVDDTGRFTALGEVHRSGVWSPDGDVVAHPVDATTAVAHPVDGIAVILRTPDDMTLGQITWEDEVHVLMVAVDSTGHGVWLRCKTDVGSCEIASNLGYASGLHPTWVVATDAPPQPH